jgi:NADH:ubiquinone oxidoreductase subunit 4 (subunit M)
MLVLIVVIGIYPNIVFKVTDGGVMQALAPLTKLLGA